jgi:hypothetical protein
MTLTEKAASILKIVAAADGARDKRRRRVKVDFRPGEMRVEV